MNISEISDFCRYVGSSAGCDDRIGLIVWEDLTRRNALLRAVTRRLGAHIYKYRAEHDVEVTRAIRVGALGGKAAVVLIDETPEGELLSLIRALVCIGERVAPAFSIDPRVVLMISDELFLSLPRGHPVLRIGCVLTDAKSARNLMEQ